MVYRRLNAKLSGNVDKPSTDANSDLGPNDLRSRATLNSVTNHKTNSHQIDHGSSGNIEFIMARILDDKSNRNGGDCRGKAKCLSDVSGSCDGIVLHDL